MCGGASSVNRSRPPARCQPGGGHQSPPSVDRPRAQPLFANDVNECRSHRRRRPENHGCEGRKAQNPLKKFLEDLIGRLRQATPPAQQPPARTPPVATPATSTPEPLATPRNQPPLPAAPPSTQFAYPV
jgi:hypothetical protein